jgi:uncharacterized membrane protein YeaQ/YmgE (transglycosylase-associated protein family)
MKTLRQLEWGAYVFASIIMTLVGGIVFSFISSLFKYEFTLTNLAGIFVGVLFTNLLIELMEIKNKDDKTPTIGDYLKSQGNKR